MYRTKDVLSFGRSQKADVRLVRVVMRTRYVVCDESEIYCMHRASSAPRRKQDDVRFRIATMRVRSAHMRSAGHGLAAEVLLDSSDNLPANDKS